MKRLRLSPPPLGDAGVVTIEFGVLLPLLLLLFFGSLEVARLQITGTLIERLAFDLAVEARLANGQVSLQTLVAQKAAQKLSPLASASDLTVTAQSGESLPLLLETPSEGTGGGGDVVRLEVKARLGLLSWLRPAGFQAERAFVIYYVNEANEYRSMDDD